MVQHGSFIFETLFAARTGLECGHDMTVAVDESKPSRESKMRLIRESDRLQVAELHCSGIVIFLTPFNVQP